MDKQRFEAIYVRQSIERDESKSIEAQIEKCKTKCKKPDEARIYIDEGYSGKNTNRPGLQNLIYDIEKGIIEKTVIYKIDRLSRKIVDFYSIWGIMEEHKCDIVAVNDICDTTQPLGKEMMGILAIFAEIERENISSRIKDTYDYRLTTGGWAVGMAPYGYENYSRPDKSKTLKPIENELNAVKYMFNAYAGDATTSINKIRTEIINKGYSGHRSDKSFSRTTIDRILRNPIYVEADNLLYKYYKKHGVEFVNSEEEWNGKRACSLVGKNGKRTLEGLRAYLTDIKPIIPSRTFITVQERLDQNSAFSRDNSPTTKLQEFAGLLKCANCGYAIKYRCPPTLTCSGRDIAKVCDVSFRGHKLDEIRTQVNKEIDLYLQNLNHTLDEKRKEHKQIEKQIDKLEKKLNNFYELAGDAETVSPALKEKIKKTNEEIGNLHLKLKTDNLDDVIALRLGIFNHSAIASLFDAKGKLIIDYTNLDIEKKQTILRVLVDKILVKKDCSIEIVYKA